MKIKELTQILEQIAPLAYQESYDNCGLLTGDPNSEVTKILITLDCTEAVMDEAIANGCNVVVAHHPIIFSGLKKITGRNYVERTIIKAIKNDIAIYAIHTNYDSVLHGVNSIICERLGISNPKILQPKKNSLMKLVSFIPKENANTVLQALHTAGAGQIGNYKNCSFQTNGTGTFLPNDKANPYIGEQGKQTFTEEVRAEVIFPEYLSDKILKSLKEAHPYEEVAYYLSKLENEHQEVGFGMIGELEKPTDVLVFLTHLKEKMSAKSVRYTATHKKEVQKIAVCGGSGRFLLNNAIAAGADVFITADFKYHEFFDADNRIVIADIGHYESEQFTKDLLKRHLLEKNSSFAVLISGINTNPVNYL